MTSKLFYSTDGGELGRYIMFRQPVSLEDAKRLLVNSDKYADDLVACDPDTWKPLNQ